MRGGWVRFINDVVFSPDITLVLSASSDKTLKLWDVKTGAGVRTFKGPSVGVEDCAFTPDGTKAISVSSQDKTQVLWDVNKGKNLEH